VTRKEWKKLDDMFEERIISEQTYKKYLKAYERHDQLVGQ